jgi:hypothetical protein
MGGGGYPTAKLDQLRVWVGGTIVSKPTTRQETEFGTGKPKTFPKSGDPIMGIIVDVQTDQRTDADDDGIRRLYIEGKRLKDAVRAGVVASGADGLDVGGQLFVAWVGEEQGQGATPAKVYEARYYAPPTTTPVPAGGAAPAPMSDPRDSFNGAQGHVPGPHNPPPPAPVAEPAPAAPMPEPGAQGATPQAQPNPQDPTPEAIAALRAAGLDPRAVFPTFQG